MQEDREKCLVAGMDDYLSRPVRIEELQSALKRVSLLSGEAANTTVDIADADAFDMSRLEELFRLDSADDIEVLSNLIDIFLEDAAKSINNLKQAMSERDTEIVMRTAHSLKGSSATIGAVRMAALTAELEKNANAGSLRRAGDIFSEVEKEFERVCDLLESKQLALSSR